MSERLWRSRACCLSWAIGMALCAPVGAQSSRYFTADQLESLLADLQERMKVPPTDQFQIYSERNWINEQLNKVKTQRAAQETTRKEGGANELSASLEDLDDALRSLGDGNLAALNQVMESRITPFLEELSELIEFKLGMEDAAAWKSFNRAERRSPLHAYLDKPEAHPLTDEQTAGSIAYLRGEFVPLARAVLEDAQKRTEAEEQSRARLVEKLKKAEETLNTYRQTLAQAQGRIAASISANLYLMILVIGALSIGAIALVRLFPEPVMLEWVASGQVIQFVTVMILISVIMALGLAGIITENTVGTLLGGIGGYVLSQGIGRSAARAAVRTMQQGTPPVD